MTQARGFLALDLFEARFQLPRTRQIEFAR